MGRGTFSSTAHHQAHQRATDGGKKSATHGAEEQSRRGLGLNPLVDPKGLPQFGPTRLSLPRFEPQPSGLWLLTVGQPMPIELLLDTTGSMGDNVDMALRILPDLYDLLASGSDAVLRRYDTQIANAVFGDVEDLDSDPNKFVLCRSQYEMDVKITEQLAMMVPSRNGCGNGKEDPQFGLFGAAYLIAAHINKYPGMKRYHFTVSDEPVPDRVDLGWLKHIYGEGMLEAATQNGHSMSVRDLPSTAQVIRDLQTQAHAFFLQVGVRPDVTSQWKGLYGKEHFIMLPDGTASLHLVEALLIGLSEGVIGLSDAKDYLRQHGANRRTAEDLVRAVSGIPLGAQAQAESFARLPKAGDLFREKTDLWPLTPEELATLAPGAGGETGEKKGAVDWI